MPYLGDVSLGQIIRHRFSTQASTGAPITLAGSPTVHCYKSNNTTEFTTGLTLSVDHDSRTGNHLLTIDTGAGSGDYVINEEFSVMLTAGTVDGVTVAPTTLCTFSIRNRMDYAVVHKLNTLFSVAFAPADAADNSLVAQLLSDSGTADADDYNNTLHSLVAIVNNTATVAELLNEALAGYTTAGTLGNLLRLMINGTATIGTDVADASLLGQLLSISDTAAFDRTKHSLQGQLTQAVVIPDVSAALNNTAGQDGNLYTIEARVHRGGTSGTDRYSIAFKKTDLRIDGDDVEAHGGGGVPTISAQEVSTAGNILFTDKNLTRAGGGTLDTWFATEVSNLIPAETAVEITVKARIDGVDRTMNVIA